MARTPFILNDGQNLQICGPNNAGYVLFYTNSSGQVELQSNPISNTVIMRVGRLSSGAFQSCVEFRTSQSLTSPSSSGTEAGRGCLRIIDNVSDRQAEFGFYEFGTGIFTNGTGPFEFWVDTGVVSLRSPETGLTEYRIECRKPVDADGINLAYSTALAAGLNGGYLRNDDTGGDPIFIKVYDGTALMVNSGGSCIFGGQPMSGTNALTLSLNAGQLASASTLNFGYWGGSFNVVDFKISRPANAVPVSIEMLYGGAATSKNVYIDEDGDWSFGTSTASAFKIQTVGSIGPSVTTTYDLGSSSRIWANTYSANIYLTSFSESSVLFIRDNAGIKQIWQDNSNFVYNSTDKRLGIGTNAPACAINAVISTATTSSPENILCLDHNSSGTPVAGFGNRLLFRLESSTTNNQEAGAIETLWLDATHASRSSALIFKVTTSASAIAEAFRIRGHTASTFALTATGHVGPAAGSTYDLGSSGTKWRALYVDSLSLGFTQGSVIFAGASGVFAQDNTNFFWNDTDNRLGIGTSSPATRLHLYQEDSSTSSPSQMLTIDHNTSGTPAAGYGSRILFRLESTTTSDQNAGALDIYWHDATHASRESFFIYYTVNSSSTLTEAVRFGQRGVGISNGGVVPAARLHITTTDAVTSATTNMLICEHNTSGTAAVGFGSRNLFRLQSSTTANRDAAAIDIIWSTATDATRTAYLKFSSTISGTLTELLRLGDPTNFAIQTTGNLGPVTDDIYNIGSDTKRFVTGFLRQIDVKQAGSSTISGILYNTHATYVGSVLNLKTDRAATTAFNFIKCEAAGSTRFLVDGTGVLGISYGGTGHSGYTKGDILVASSSTNLNKHAVGVNGQVLYSDSSQTNGVKWDNLFGFGSIAGFQDDFIGFSGNGGDTNWNKIEALPDNGEAGHPGVVQITAVATGGQVSVIRKQENSVRLGGGALSFKAVVKLNSLSAAADDYTVAIGLVDSDNLLTPITYGVWFEYNRKTNGDANWRGQTKSGGSTTKVDTGIAASTNWVTLELQVNAAGSSVSFYINGSSVGSTTSTIPTSNNIGPGLHIYKEDGSTSRSFQVDLVALNIALTTSRS